MAPRDPKFDASVITSLLFTDRMLVRHPTNLQSKEKRGNHPQRTNVAYDRKGEGRIDDDDNDGHSLGDLISIDTLLDASTRLILKSFEGLKIPMFTPPNMVTIKAFHSHASDNDSQCG